VESRQGLNWKGPIRSPALIAQGGFRWLKHRLCRCQWNQPGPAAGPTHNRSTLARRFAATWAIDTASTVALIGHAPKLPGPCQLRHRDRQGAQPVSTPLDQVDVAAIGLSQSARCGFGALNLLKTTVAVLNCRQHPQARHGRGASITKFQFDWLLKQPAEPNEKIAAVATRADGPAQRQQAGGGARPPQADAHPCWSEGRKSVMEEEEKRIGPLCWNGCCQMDAVSADRRVSMGAPKTMPVVE